MINRKEIDTRYYKTMEKILNSIPLPVISPNVVSTLALFCGLISATFFGTGHTLYGGLLLLISGMLDTIDGTVARMNNVESKFGAQLDSSLDRYIEFAVFLGILFYYRTDWIFFVVFLAMVGSIMVSYTRARAESLGVNKIVGLMSRTERFILLSTGGIINALVYQFYGTDIVFKITLILLAILSNITAFHRVLIVKQEEKSGNIR